MPRALLVTEWGATTDPATFYQTEDQFDARLVPWLYWSYNGLVVADSKQPLVAPNLNVTVLDALTRPYPTCVNGTPTRSASTPRRRRSTSRSPPDDPTGTARPRGLETVVKVPTRTYPTGYAVTVTGADVTSRPSAPTLTLRNRPGATTVSVRITPSTCH